MLTVRDLLSAPTLSDARCIFDDEMGYDKVVTGFGTFDVEALLDRYHTFQPSEVLGTNLSFSGGDEAKANEGLIRQMESGISAIFIRDTLFTDLLPETKAKARETETPLFFFHRAYMEDMVTEIRTMFIVDQEQERRRVVVDDLVNARSVPDRRRMFCDTTGLVGGCAACMAFLPRDHADSLTVRVVSQALGEEAARERDVGCFVCQYRQGWVVLAASDYSLADMDSQMITLGERLADAAGIPLACGLGNAVALEDVGQSIVQALQAAKFAAAGQAPCRWRDSGWAAFVGAAKASPLFAGQAGYVRGKLAEHDTAYGTDLLDTVRTFVKCGGVVQATAEALHLHPNSVRNRVVRASQLLGVEGEPERALFAYFAVMLLDEGE